jgi:hypothetical protein
MVVKIGVENKRFSSAFMNKKTVERILNGELFPQNKSWYCGIHFPL